MLEFKLVPRPFGGDPYHEVWRRGVRIGKLYKNGEWVYAAENTVNGPIEVFADDMRAILAFTERGN